MSSDGGWETFARLLAGVAQKREAPVTPQPPKPPSPAAEQRSKAVLEFLESVSEAVRVYEELLEYHGGDQEAHTYLLALGYLGQTPDDVLERDLRRTIQERIGGLELRRLWRLLDQPKKRRIDRTGPTDRIKRISSGFRRSYGSNREALDTLANYHRDSETQVLEDAIQEQVCSEGTWLLLDKDIMREVGNGIRREATKARNASFAGPLLLPDDQVSEAMGGRADSQAFDVAARLQQLVDRAGLSAQEEESFFILERMTSKQAAKELGRSPEQLRQEKHRALQKLRRAAAP